MEEKEKERDDGKRKIMEMWIKSGKNLTAEKGNRLLPVWQVLTGSSECGECEYYRKQPFVQWKREDEWWRKKKNPKLKKKLKGEGKKEMKLKTEKRGVRGKQRRRRSGRQKGRGREKERDSGRGFRFTFSRGRKKRGGGG
jgi:hypothetical protein